MSMKSKEVLQKIKERVRQQQNAAGEGVRASVKVALGTCGIALGANDTLAAIVDEIESKHISDVVVSQTGCMGLCASEPVVQIQVGEQEPVVYGKISTAHVPELVEKHIVQGEVITEWLVNRDSLFSMK
jgi:(2Fe-2S) ferredoxin